ncbi:hypothetical protein OM960_13440 [Defluviimonas sp. CAU 1641]|uniref:Phage integrase family protein n=1 Tax=Defluviimonas salinarum TaxID=2992147 RepID=A0ABT3J547_9RHOB|nr:hypothetical protein [Defluviimonas salinarum]
MNALNRIADCVEKRAAILKRVPVLADLAEQTSIRSKALSKSTINLEIAAIRKVVAAVEIEDGLLAWPEGTHPRDWMADAPAEDLDGLRVSLDRPYRTIMDDAGKLLERDMEVARRNGFDLGEEEMIELLSGKRGNNGPRHDQKAQRHLTWRDLMALEIELSDHDPLDSLTSLKSGKTRLEGTLRLFINVTWFTGMRPVEVWACCLMVPRTDIPFTQEMRDMIVADPARAIGEDLMMTVEQAATHTGDSLGMTARNAMIRAGAPCVLMITSAKTRNANPELKSPYRLQILKDIPLRQLNLIALATQGRRLRLTDKRKDSIRASMTKLLKAAARREPLLADLNLNLYAFRHSFATRAKRAMDSHEAAALTGHTSEATLHVYGERNVRKGGKTKMRNEDWLPSPDPVFAAMIKEIWERPSGTGPAAAPKM